MPRCPALDFLVLADDVVEHLPRGRGHLADQLSRAATSIVLNIAAGAGKFSKPDKRRYYLTAVGSATESSRLKLITPERQAEGKAMLERVTSMLIKLARNPEASS